MSSKLIDSIALTFDDVLLVPQYSTVKSRQDVNLKTKISKNVSLNMPLVSSNMDTVTEDKMAIAMARNGGLGIIHRYCSIDEQVKMVQTVKRAESYIIYDPYTANCNDTIARIRERIKETGVNSYLIVNHMNTLGGIITRRDIKFANPDDFISKHMTLLDTMTVVFETQNISMEQAMATMSAKRIQKLPIIDNNYRVKGLICLKDIERIHQRPLANLDSQGRLRCGAAIGVKDDAIERAKKLIDAGVDVLVIDIAHGHSVNCIETLTKIKEQFPKIDVIAGNIATARGALDLIIAGADGIKLGVGNGSICITRIVSGAGVPQFSALLDVAPICKEHGVPLISDGGNRNSGNICKALAAGADCVMLGRMIAGTDESPTPILLKDGKRVKVIRGMAGYMANLSNAQRQGIPEPDSVSFTPEGVEGYVPYCGPVSETLKRICDGIRSGVSYSGANNIMELHDNAKFIRLSANSIIESGVHDIMM